MKTALLPFKIFLLLAGPLAGLLMANPHTVNFDTGLLAKRSGGGALMQSVPTGSAAVAPTLLVESGWVFTGWDAPLTNVGSNLYIKAKYQLQTFPVTFDLGARGTLQSGFLQQPVPYQGEAEAPLFAVQTGWTFTGWDQPLDDVQAARAISAIYQQNSYTVRFEPGGQARRVSGGALVQSVLHGEAALAPVLTVNPGWTFTGWDNAFSSITGNLTVSAIYQPVTVEGNTFHVREGATGAGTSWADATGNLQQAIDQCAASGGGQVWISEGTYVPDRVVHPSAGLSSSTVQSGSVAQGEWRYFQIVVPPGSGNLTANMTGTGDADLYLGRSVRPTTTSFSARSFGPDSNESAFLSPSGIGTGEVVHIGVRGFSEDSDFTLEINFGARDRHFSLRNGVTVLGGFPATGEPLANQRDPAAHPTLCSGQLTPSLRALHVFYHPSAAALDASAVLDGITISGGRADFTGEHRDGGAMFNFFSSPTIRNCIFRDNSAIGRGGAVFSRNSGARFIDCHFEANTAPFGGAFFETASSLRVQGCRFLYNIADNGGALGGESPAGTYLNGRFDGNRARFQGGAAHLIGGSCTFTNCAFVGNSASTGGGLSAGAGAALRVTHCTLTANQAAATGGGLALAGGASLILDNSIVHSNTATASATADVSGAAHVTMSGSVVGGASGPGISSANPAFAIPPADGGDGWGDNPETAGIDESANDHFGDLRLRDGSPAVDLGISEKVPADAFDLDADGDILEPLPFDIAGNPRLAGFATDAGISEGSVPFVGFTTALQRVDESIGVVNLDIALSSKSTTDVTLVATISPASGAIRNSDYTIGTSAQVVDIGGGQFQITIPAGSLLVSIPVTVIADGIPEAPEPLLIDLATTTAIPFPGITSIRLEIHDVLLPPVMIVEIGDGIDETDNWGYQDFGGEYIELFNPSSVPVSLLGWTLTVTPAGMPPNATQTFTFSNSFFGTPRVIPPLGLFVVGDSNITDNSSGGSAMWAAPFGIPHAPPATGWTMVLRNAANEVVDTIEYSNAGGNGPWPYITRRDAIVFAGDPSDDNNDPALWQVHHPVDTGYSGNGISPGYGGEQQQGIPSYQGEPEPEEHIANLTATTVGQSITLAWDDYFNTGYAGGFLIVGSSAGTALLIPQDGVDYPADNDLSDGSFVIKQPDIYFSSTTIGRLKALTTYQFRVYPYTNSGTAIDYKTDGIVPQATVTTGSPLPRLMITEILTYSDDFFGGETYIEIFNPEDYAVDLTGWSFIDDSFWSPYDSLYTVGSIVPTAIPPRSAVVVVYYPSPDTPYYGNPPLYLRHNLVLLAPDGLSEIDRVEYDRTVVGDWPGNSEPGIQSAMVYIGGVNDDNNLASNWIEASASNTFEINGSPIRGTPGVIGADQRVEVNVDSGPDFLVADYDGNGGVTVRLDASRTNGLGHSYLWTWPGGSLTGEIVDASFPVSPDPVTVTLTVTDLDGLVKTDTLVVRVADAAGLLPTELTGAGFGSLNGAIALSETHLVAGGDLETYSFERVGEDWIKTGLGFSSTRSLDVAVTPQRLVYMDFFTVQRPVVLDLVNGNWVPDTNLPGPFQANPSWLDQTSLAAEGEHVILGVPQAGTSTFERLGQVHAYRKSGGVWTQQIISNTGGATSDQVGDRWGASVAISGNRLAIGVPRDRDLVNFNRLGSVQLYQWNESGGTWSFDQEITGPAGWLENEFGYSVALEGDSLVVGAPFTFSNPTNLQPGAVMVYDLAGGPAVLSQTFLGSDDGTLSRFGESVAIRSGVIAVGSPGDDARGLDAGAAFLYRKPGPSEPWQGSRVASGFLPAGGKFGSSVALNASTLAVASSSFSNSVRVFDLAGLSGGFNIEPTADAGADRSLVRTDNSPVTITLDASASFDYEELPLVRYEWWFPGVAEPLIGRIVTAQVSGGTTGITLRVVDSGGAVGVDTINVNVQQGPTAISRGNLVIIDTDNDGFSSVRLDGSGSFDREGPLQSYEWEWAGGFQSGAISTGTFSQTRNPLNVGLRVTDQSGLSNTSSFQLQVLSSNSSPEKISAQDGEAGSAFGSSVDTAAGVTVTGAPSKDDYGPAAGLAHVHAWDGLSWREQILVNPASPPAANHRYGAAVGISENFIAIGAPGAASQGRVIIFKKSGASWVWSQTLDHPLAAAGANFGESLAIDGGNLVIAAPTEYRGDELGIGYAYRLNIISGQWEYDREFLHGGSATFGTGGFDKVAIAGELMVAGAQTLGDYFGQAFVYRDVAGEWALEATLANPFPLPQVGAPFFGQAVATDGESILIGAPQLDRAFDSPYLDGVAYAYRRIAGEWILTQELVAEKGYGSNGKFATSLAFDQGAAVIGIGNGNFVNETGDRVEFYREQGDSWFNTGSYGPSSNADRGDFGGAVALADGLVVVGAKSATGRTSGSGATFIFTALGEFSGDANYEPIANPGPDRVVNDITLRDPSTNLITEPLGSEPVSLDGSGSYDIDGRITDWLWSWPGGSASGATASARFPVGTTAVTLTVIDDAGIIDRGTFNITVTLSQTPPAVLPGSNNTLTVNLPVPGAKWRLSSEFLWHGSGESADDVVLGQTYQIEILGYPGSAEAVTTFATISSASTVANLTLILPLQPLDTGTISYPETAQGFAWRLRGEPTWRNVLDDGDAFDERVEATLTTGELVIDYKPVSGYATPASQLVAILPGQTLALNWNDYQRIDNFDIAKTFTAVPSEDLGGAPYQYVGMIRTPLGRGTGTVVAERVVLTAAHLFFDSTGLQWADTQWFPRQQQGERQAPPVAPRGILYQTAYAQIVAPDSVQNPVATVPADKKEADFAVLYFSGEGDWEGGSANYLQSTAERNWLTGTENKQAVGYAQRSQPYEQRGMIFGKTIATALSPVDIKPLPLIYETGELFGDGGASGSALFVQPQGASGYYPAAILLAGQDRAVYRVIDSDVGRMIQDAQDAASGNAEVLNNSFSLVTYGGSGLRALQVSMVTEDPNQQGLVTSTARWTVKPNVGTTYSNLTPTQRVGFSSTWGSVTVSFTAVPGFITPPSIMLQSSQVPPGGITTIGNVVYEPVSGFDLWKQSEGITSDDDDRDKDGRSALIEYALNGDPDRGSDPAPIRMAANPLQNVNAEFEVFVSATADGIRYEVKASDTLPPTNIVTLATFTKADGTNGYKRVVDSQPRSASPRRFAWVEITHDRSLSTGP